MDTPIIKSSKRSLWNCIFKFNAWIYWNNQLFFRNLPTGSTSLIFHFWIFKIFKRNNFYSRYLPIWFQIFLKVLYFLVKNLISVLIYLFMTKNISMTTNLCVMWLINMWDSNNKQSYWFWNFLKIINVSISKSLNQNVIIDYDSTLIRFFIVYFNKFFIFSYLYYLLNLIAI